MVNPFLAEVIGRARGAKMSAELAKQAIGCLDLTSLNDGDTTAQIDALCAKAKTPYGNVAAICIAPKFVAHAAAKLAGSGIKIATVVNFPTGAEKPDAISAMTEKAIKDGADEIDIVIPWQEFLRGDETPLRYALHAAKQHTQAHGKLLKAILETGALKDSDIIGAAASAALHAGADFLKTSTGKIEAGASLEAACEMMAIISGICQMLLRDTGPARFRIGASALLDNLVALIAGKPSAKSSSAY